MPINYIKGDATQPVSDGTKIIVHVCNDAGAWGAGFVLAVSKRWPSPEHVYLNAFRNALPRLGDIQVVPVRLGLIVINMIAQHGFFTADCTSIPLRYNALQECLRKVGNIARKWNASVHMPRIGCGLAGGSWSKVEPIITEQLSGLTVTVYDL